jgi:hypothetical protein
MQKQFFTILLFALMAKFGTAQVFSKGDKLGVINAQFVTSSKRTNFDTTISNGFVANINGLHFKTANYAMGVGLIMEFGSNKLNSGNRSSNNAIGLQLLSRNYLWQKKQAGLFVNSTCGAQYQWGKEKLLSGNTSFTGIRAGINFSLGASLQISKKLLLEAQTPNLFGINVNYTNTKTINGNFIKQTNGALGFPSNFNLQNLVLGLAWRF